MDKSGTLIKRLKTEAEAHYNTQKNYLKLTRQRATLEGQYNENEWALDELKLLGPDNKVYKLHGPVLVKQDPEEARKTVTKRMEYINKEIKSTVKVLENLEKDIQRHREMVHKLQEQYSFAAAMK